MKAICALCYRFDSYLHTVSWVEIIHFIFRMLTEKKPVPIVQLVVEGGLDTLETVSYSIKNQTPTVIVKNSGGAADI